MATVKHAKTLTGPDGARTDLAQPTDWNADHDVTLEDADIPATIARDAEVSAAIAALSSVYQPLDADLTSIAALSTTAFGRALLELANAAALWTAADGDTAAGALITTHTADDDAHHAKYTDAEAVAAALAGDLSGLKADTIAEKTADAGVTIDGVLLKDTSISFGDESLGTFDTGSFTPTLGFLTAGDENIVLSAAVGLYERIGNTVHVWGRVTTSTFTHSTASGALTIGGLPFTVAAGNYYPGHMLAQGWTSSTVKDTSAIAIGGTTGLQTYRTASGGALGVMNQVYWPTGSSVDIFFENRYQV